MLLSDDKKFVRNLTNREENNSHFNFTLERFSLSLLHHDQEILAAHMRDVKCTYIDEGSVGKIYHMKIQRI
jgi:hypothetical protein